MRYFARANVGGFIPPGPWVELKEAQFRVLQRNAKVKPDTLNFHKNGVETQGTSDDPVPAVYENLYPELTELLKATRPNPTQSSRVDMGNV